MTFEERLDALTQSMELLVAMYRDHEVKQLDYEAKQLEREAAADRRRREDDERFRQVTRNFEIVRDSLVRLENIASAHEQRLDQLDQQN